MKKIYLLFLFIITFSLAYAQAPATFTVEVPEGTTSVRMRGSFWGWDPNAGPIATPNGLDNTWSVTLWADNSQRSDFEYDWYVDGAFETVPTGCSGRVQGLNINDYGGGVNRKYDPTQTSVYEIVNSCYLATESLQFKGVADFTVPEAGSNGKMLHFYVSNDIADLSTYGIGSANNGGGTDGQEYTFPVMAANAGDHILLARSLTALTNYFVNLDQFDIKLEDALFPDANGDDAYELFLNGSVIETFGDVDCRPSSVEVTT